MRIDLGDVVAHINLEVPGLRRYHFRWHVGPALDTTPPDRIPPGPGTPRSTRKVDLIMDLAADQKVALSLQWTDEMGNLAEAPADGGAVTYTVDNADVIALTDNGDGTAVAAATGQLGNAVVHVDAQAGGRTRTGDLSLVVVAGLAERVSVVAGAPEEVTPDDL